MRSTPTISGRLFVALIPALLGFAALLLWLSGNWRWVEGWLFGLWFVALMGGSLLWMYFKDPELLAERLRIPGTGGESRIDLAILIGIKMGGFAWFLLPSLDVRYSWAPRLPLWSEACGGLLLLGASFFMFRSITDNTFVSQLVRIQSERQQRVIDTGVYGFVRHPLYLGGDLMFVGGALLRGSTIGLLVAFAMVLLLVLRIFVEEKLLVSDLDGYTAYRGRVRYRLVPHVW